MQIMLHQVMQLAGFSNSLLRTFSKVFFIAFLFILSQACAVEATEREGDTTHQTIESASDTQETISFITVRNKTGSTKPSNYFGDERNTAYSGYCDVSRMAIKPLQALAEKASFYIPDEVLKLAAIRQQSTDEVWSALLKTSNGDKPILYLHGFYIDFNKACKRASLFQNALALRGRFLLFSWPSDGAILNYTRDESDLFWSVAPLEQVINEMIKRFGAGNSDIVAHSLGTRGVFLALIRMTHTQQSDKPLLDQVILIAPDIDAGIFEQYLAQIRPLARNITIYVSENDHPLALSRQVHGYPRLGEAGAHLGELRDIDIIDVSDVPVRYPSGHVYHLYHPAVISDLNQLLNQGKSVSQRNNLQQTGPNYWRLQPEASKDESDQN